MTASSGLPLEIVSPDGHDLNAVATQRNFDAISQGWPIVPGTGGQYIEIRQGSATVTYTASQNSALLTITHGLGRIPIAITLGSADGFVKPAWTNKTTTTFQLVGRHEVVVTGTSVIDWIAIG